MDNQNFFLEGALRAQRLEGNYKKQLTQFKKELQPAIDKLHAGRVMIEALKLDPCDLAACQAVLGDVAIILDEVVAAVIADSHSERM
ncbi:MAG: hypothetical protein AAF850_03675 [Pseudomonadota bacterium]